MVVLIDLHVSVPDLPFVFREPTRPPIRSRPSSIVTVIPFSDNTSAHLKPENPAPTMQTCGIFAAEPGLRRRATRLNIVRGLFSDEDSEFCEQLGRSRSVLESRPAGL